MIKHLMVVLVMLMPSLSIAETCGEAFNDARYNLSLCLKEAGQGDLYAQYSLGFMYRLGKGVAQDYKESIFWYKKASSQGHTDAHIKVGLAYEDGKGVTQDYKEAVRYYRKAANQEYADAQSFLGYAYYFGKGVTQDYVASHMWFNLASSNGDKSAGNNRESVAKGMTPSQIEEAQEMAREWKPSK